MHRWFEKPTLLIFLAIVPSVMAFQGGARPAPPSAPATTSAQPTRRRLPVTKRGGPRNSEISKLSDVVIIVTPSASTVWLNNQKLPDLSSDGSVSLTDLKPGNYVLTIRHDGYVDQVRSVELKPGTNESITFALEQLKGTLIVKPSVDGTAIEIRSIDQNQSVGSYAGAIDGVDFPPGEYELTVSKPGYKPKTRTFNIKSGGLIELEPTIEPLPTPTPTPRLLIPSQSSVSKQGEYLLVRLVGASGDVARTAGTMNVTVNRLSATAYVQESLNGAPCKIVFVPLDNIYDWVFTDLPAASNNWALIGAAVRPKDSKRPVRFAINWVEIQNSANSSLEPQQEVPLTSEVSRAVPMRRVIPTVPASARASRIRGVVKVSVLVDEEGNVKSANALDGPPILRRAAEDAARGWKFKPAIRNGVPTQSTEFIYFNFEGY